MHTVVFIRKRDTLLYAVIGEAAGWLGVGTAPLLQSVPLPSEMPRGCGKRRKLANWTPFASVGRGCRITGQGDELRSCGVAYEFDAEFGVRLG